MERDVGTTTTDCERLCKGTGSHYFQGMYTTYTCSLYFLYRQISMTWRLREWQFPETSDTIKWLKRTIKVQLFCTFTYEKLSYKMNRFWVQSAIQKRYFDQRNHHVPWFTRLSYFCTLISTNCLFATGTSFVRNTKPFFGNFVATLRWLTLGLRFAILLRIDSTVAFPIKSTANWWMPCWKTNKTEQLPSITTKYFMVILPMRLESEHNQVCLPIKAKFRSRAFTSGSIWFLTPFYYSFVWRF